MRPHDISDRDPSAGGLGSAPIAVCSEAEPATTATATRIRKIDTRVRSEAKSEEERNLLRALVPVRRGLRVQAR